MAKEVNWFTQTTGNLMAGIAGGFLVGMAQLSYHSGYMSPLGFLVAFGVFVIGAYVIGWKINGK
jgi:hypothetical protein